MSMLDRFDPENPPEEVKILALGGIGVECGK